MCFARGAQNFSARQSAKKKAAQRDKAKQLRRRCAAAAGRRGRPAEGPEQQVRRRRSAAAEAERLRLEVEKKKRSLDRQRRTCDRFVPDVMHSERTGRPVIFRPGLRQASGFRPVDLDLVHGQLLPHVRCVRCKRMGKMLIEGTLEQRTRRGFASDLPLFCRVCRDVTIVWPTSKRLPAAKGVGLSEINMRAAVGATQVGMGEAETRRFGACLNMPVPSHDCFVACERVHREAAVKVGKESMATYLELEKQLAYEADDSLLNDTGAVGIQIEMDGQYQKPGRGYNSKEGAVTATGGRTQKVRACDRRAHV